METWDAVRARRNVRTYDTRPVPAEHLERIAEAARRAPSASNRQRWDFVLVTEEDRLQALSTVWQGARHLAAAAAAIVMVLPEPTEERFRILDQYDLGQATMLMMLTAADLGIGSGHSSVGDQDAARNILDIPADHFVAYMLALGYPADRPLRPIVHPNRRPFDDVVHREHW
jgi:nitroreductase